MLFLLALPAPRARAADPKDDKKKKEYEDVRFDTSDGVEIRGRFYASTGGKKAPAVMVLPKVGGDIQQDGWDRLAETLKKEGYSVLLFDYRGHGDSKSVSPDFWKYQYNKAFKGADAREPKTAIDTKDFPRGYAPYLVNDVAAAKLFLDRKNDGGECNSSNMIVIGAEDGACLGMMWLYSEWNRFQLILPAPAKKPPSEGSDVACVISLSFNKTPIGTGPISVKPNGVGDWFRLVARDKKVPTYFLYGDADEPSKDFSKYWVDLIRAKDTKDSKEHKGHTLTGAKEIERGGKVTGNQLLQKDLDTTKFILKYLEKVQEDRGPTEWVEHENNKKGFVWSFPNSPPIQAKMEKQKELNPLPLNVLLR
jgi:hypothetical protein